MSLTFTLTHSAPSTSARTGLLRLGRTEVPTPVFMPVGSQATVKTLTPDDLRSLDYRLILCNTYHLYLRPGLEVIRQLGGLHRFMAWDGAILTDSGGYQLFSLSPLARVTEEGVVFRSHIDGSEHFLTPEKAIELQQGFGSNIMMALDHPPAHGCTPDQAREATERTHRWARRCRDAWSRRPGLMNQTATGGQPGQGLINQTPTDHQFDQALFGIAQGGLFPELRKLSAETIVSMDFPGYAVGGLSLGEDKPTTYEMVKETVSRFPADKPRYLMGVGAPEDLLEAVCLGIDMFDSALPTRVARNGALFTRNGRRNIRHAQYRLVDAPVDPACSCYTCAHFSAAYLHHLFRAQELLFYRLATIHNLKFIQDLMTNIRTSLAGGSFLEFKKDFLSNYRITDQDARVSQKQKWLGRQRAEGHGLISTND